jgi:integrase
MRLKADDLALLSKITEHGLRHKFATAAARNDLRVAMAQGGWTRSVEFRRAVVGPMRIFISRQRPCSTFP